MKRKLWNFRVGLLKNELLKGFTCESVFFAKWSRNAINEKPFWARLNNVSFFSTHHRERFNDTMVFEKNIYKNSIHDFKDWRWKKRMDEKDTTKCVCKIIYLREVPKDHPTCVYVCIFTGSKFEQHLETAIQKQQHSGPPICILVQNPRGKITCLPCPVFGRPLNKR